MLAEWAVGGDLDIWESTPEFETVRPGHGEEFAPYLQMRWHDGSTTAEVRIEKLGSALRATEIALRSVDGVPAEVRRVPSDALILQHLRNTGTTGISTIAFLLRDHEGLSSAFEEVRRGSDREATQAEHQAALELYGRQFTKRPRVRIDEQTRLAAKWLGQGWSTSQIIEELRSRGLAERTAYRRLLAARTLDQDLLDLDDVEDSDD